MTTPMKRHVLMLDTIFQQDLGIAYRVPTKQGVGKKYIPIMAIGIKNINGDGVLDESNGVLDVDYIIGTATENGEAQYEFKSQGVFEKEETVRYFSKGEFVVFEGDTDILINMYRRFRILETVSKVRTINDDILRRINRFMIAIGSSNGKINMNEETDGEFESKIAEAVKEFEGIVEASRLEELAKDLPYDSNAENITPGTAIDIIFPSQTMDDKAKYELLEKYEYQGKLSGLKLIKSREEYVKGFLLNIPYMLAIDNVPVIDEEVTGGLFDRVERDREIRLVMNVEEMDANAIVVGEASTMKYLNGNSGKVTTLLPAQFVSDKQYIVDNMVVVGYNGSLDIDQILFPQEHYIAGTTMFEHSRALNEVFNNMGQIYEIVNKNLFSTLLSRKLFDTCFRQQVEDQAQTYNTDDWKVIGVSFSPIGFFLEGNTVNDRCMYRMGATFLVDKR